MLFIYFFMLFMLLSSTDGSARLLTQCKFLAKVVGTIEKLPNLLDILRFFT